MNLLNAFLRDPGVCRRWEAADWNRFLPLARNARLLGRCLHLFEQHGLVDCAPARLLDQLRGGLVQTRYVQGQARRELREVARVLQAEGIRLMALKGLAYLHADLPPAGWRNLNDIDIMVAEQDVARAERALLAAGWGPSGDYDAYDQRYYRDWMHEVPPLIHHDRIIEVDLHHNLAPPVSRVRIAAERLWEQATAIGDAPAAVYVLGPADLLLHNAVHLFMNDELRGGLRDVMDFRDLFEHFRDHQADFEQTLLSRALALGCGRPLYYALTTAEHLVGLKPSAGLRDAIAAQAPPCPVAGLMAWLIEQVLSPSRLRLRRSRLAEWLLFVRSHWVRMPLPLLVRHLWHKSVRSKQLPTTIEETPG